MQDGDLSNDVAPRALMVFEGLIAYPDEGVLDGLALRAAVRTHRWPTVLKHWQFDDTTVKQMFDMAYRRNLRFDVVTFLYSVEFAVALYEHLSDLMGFPVSNVLHFADAQDLARNLAFMPDVRIVYDGDRSRVGAYGGKGKLVLDRARDFYG